MCGHLCRGHHHAVDVAQWVDALAGQPVIQPHSVGAGGECLGECKARAMLVHQSRQCFRVGHAFALQGRGQVDRLGVLVQPHEHRHITGRYAANAKMHGVDQAIQAVRGVQFAADQLVAQPRPRAWRLRLRVRPCCWAKPGWPRPPPRRSRSGPCSRCSGWASRAHRCR